MCGIVGILGNSSVSGRVFDALKRLEYRGYDSAGIATLDEAGKLHRVRAVGKLAALSQALEKNTPVGHVGIGHTRWATHGTATEDNAHPHIAGRVAVVHNGIIENFAELRAALQAKGVTFTSQTDTEVVAAAVSLRIAAGALPFDAVAATLKELKGAFALVFLFAGQENLMIAARKGSPLALGRGKGGEMFVGSDALALAPFTNRITYLEEGDSAVLRRGEAIISDRHGTKVTRPEQHLATTAYALEKGNHQHFMHKEIYEQPEAVGHCLGHYLDLAMGATRFPEVLTGVFKTLERISISACGTAYYAGIVGKYWLESIARIPVDVEIASEFRYREPPLVNNTLALVISQSGETADTLAALRYYRENGALSAAVVNVEHSTIAREADHMLQIYAGVEVGVASTKAFTAQLATLAALTLALAEARGVLAADALAALARALSGTPRLLAEALALEGTLQKLARPLSKAKSVLFLGRGSNYPLALEGALKLKELSYIHAEAYAFGELKHGPIALIDEKLPVVAVAPFDTTFEKALANMQEVAAREGRILLFTDAAGAKAAREVPRLQTVVLPDTHEWIAPLLYALPLQLLAYHVAVFMGTDVDQPRNLAKSVTVE